MDAISALKGVELMPWKERVQSIFSLLWWSPSGEGGRERGLSARPVLARLGVVGEEVVEDEVVVVEVDAVFDGGEEEEDVNFGGGVFAVCVGRGVDVEVEVVD